ncbi:hypothetical protein [Microvirga arsenatis]|uniref:Uncharacterized protein n=1 Tax=Microvirga arsenatis TaxID=2692265 RepID=A0ABW9YVT3_9HYPH|nr:hypothetical protein [Microvirga arsenatis]NBJ10925.1 hypothetical protein [Microvirga arsenatis]NBJ24178.1 hypothetical protein [Microvirga arsenatis]
MSVDMYEERFREELEKLPRFVPDDSRVSLVWNHKIPAWRALFTSLCLYGHSMGYRLPSFEDFFRYCESAYTKRHPNSNYYSRFFEDPLLAGMRQRISAWYESGMAEAYLYACLVEAVEDKSKAGLVLYDPRADWKLKADMIVIINHRPLRVSAFFSERSERPNIEARRDKVERIRKINTTESSHWNNRELSAMQPFEIARADTDLQVVNGVRLFSLAAINSLFESLYKEARIDGWLFP